MNDVSKVDYRKVAKWLIFFVGAFAIVMVAVYFLYTTRIDLSQSIDTSIFASYGTLVGGLASAVLTIASIYLIIQTITEQRNHHSEVLREQENQFLKSQIESRYFQIIRLHRDNVADMTINERSGQKVILSLVRELECSLEIVKNLTAVKEQKLNEEDALNIAYICFYYGAKGERSIEMVRRRLQKYSELQYEFYLGILLRNYEENSGHLKEREKFDYELFEGHQSRLGHYFRHLFQSVQYIDKQQKTLLTYKEKYQLIKTLRGQMSTSEQVLFFMNSLSDIGKTWEKDKNLTENDRLITKYNLIKNIPMGYTWDVDVRKYYHQVRFEGDPYTEERRSLESRYS